MDWIASRTKPLVIGHRGLSIDNVENSLNSIITASESCDVVEIDVRQLRDGTCVVFHDETTERATGDLIPLADATFPEIAHRAIFDSDETIPRLGSALQVATTPLLIEVKDGVDVSAVLATISGYGNMVFLQSFDPDIVRLISDAAEEYPFGLLCTEEANAGSIGVPDNVVTNAESGIRFVESLNGDFVSIPSSFVSEEVCSLADELGVAVFVWDITSQSESERVLSLGADGVIIDAESHRPSEIID